MRAIDELIKKLKEINNKGFIQSLRRGSTGIGFTLETTLGIQENRFRGPDYDIYELKAKRRNTNSKSSLFVPNWILTAHDSWKDVVKEYGHRWPINKNQKLKGKALFPTLQYERPNNRGWYLRISNDQIQSMFNDKIIAFTYLSDVEKLFNDKLTDVIYVLADSEIIDGNECFHYNKVYQLEDTSFENFINQIKADRDRIVVEYRMGIHLNGKFERHGNAFRANRKAIFAIYEKITEII